MWQSEGYSKQDDQQPLLKKRKKKKKKSLTFITVMAFMSIIAMCCSLRWLEKRIALSSTEFTSFKKQACFSSVFSKVSVNTAFKFFVFSQDLHVCLWCSPHSFVFVFSAGQSSGIGGVLWRHGELGASCRVSSVAVKTKAFQSKNFPSLMSF